MALAVVVSLLPGCAQLPTSGALPAMSRPARAAIDAYSLDGRIAVRDGERSHAANLFWRHAAVRDEMLFTTPLGQGLAELTRDEAGARLRLADRREFAAADWDELASQLFGLALPLSALPRWLVGNVPASVAPLELDPQGRPRRVRSDGWRIDYLEYESPAADALPTLIELRRDDIEVRLKIDEWQLTQ